LIRILFLSISFCFQCLFPQLAYAQCVNPTASKGEVIFNETYDVLQGCTARGWMAFHEPAPPDPCALSPSPGDVCADGTIYAGLSPDGNVAMYTTPADAGLFTWNDDGLAGDAIDTPMVNCVSTEVSCRSGEDNTALLITEDSDSALAGIQPHNAAHHCSDLVAHGHSDWYLPAIEELGILFDNLVDQNGDNTPGGPLGSTFAFDTSGVFPGSLYRTSSEGDNLAWVQRFGDGLQFDAGVHGAISVRCVRK